MKKILRFLPSIFLLISAGLIYFSIEEPYWEMHLDAPQYEYRGGLDIIIFIDRIEGKDPVFDDLRELNSLNHYIGMRSLTEAARLERTIAIPTMYIFTGLLVLSAIIFALKRTQWTFLAWLLALPAFTFPFVFVADLYFWLDDSGQNLDQSAPFSSSIEPFTPPVYGEGTIGQFNTIADFSNGFYMAVGASVAILLAMAATGVYALMNRRAQKQAQTELETEANAS